MENNILARPMDRITDPMLPTDVSTTMPSISAYWEYPSTQPFIHDDYRRNEHDPLTAYPESNRKAVMSALKNLQDKIRHLELEKNKAGTNGRDVGSHVGVHRSSQLPRAVLDVVTDKPAHSETVAASANAHGKLDSAEERCRALDRQLESMRQMLQQADRDRSEALRQSQVLRQSESQRRSETRRRADHGVDLATERRERRAQLEKIDELEREQIRLTAMQTIAQNKIQELEEMLQEETYQRKLLQRKTAERDAATQPERVQVEPHTEPKPTKTKKKKVPTATLR